MKVSVITVAYNSATEIGQTIESVLAQSYPPVEYFIIDGDSTDSTVEVAESYRRALEERGVAYHIASEPDKGIYDAMNKGIRMVNGEAVCILNAGDWYAPDMLEASVQTMERECCDLTFGNICIWRQDGSHFVKKARLRNFQTSRDWNHPTMMVKSYLYKQCPFLGKGIHDDYGFYLRMRRMGVSIRTIDQTLANFQMGGASNHKSFKAAKKRISDRYQYCYRANGYSRWYLLECIMIEAVKMILG